MVEVPRMAAVSTGWQADFSIPTVAPHLGGFTVLKARIDSDKEVVQLMDLERRPMTSWKLRWHVDPKTIRTQDDEDNAVLSRAMRAAEVARTAMGAEAVEKSKREAQGKAEAGALAQRLADDMVQVSLMMVGHLPQYKDLGTQYESMIRLGADLTRSGLFMDAVRVLAQTLDEIDHIEAMKGIDPDMRSMVTGGLATLCDEVAQAAETNAIRTNLGRMASGLRSIGAQLSDDPTLSLEELRGATQRELDSFADEMTNAVLSAEDATKAENVLTELLLKQLKATTALGPQQEGALRSQLASGGTAQDWLASQAATDEIRSELEAIKEKYLGAMQWSVATPTPEALAREAAANGHNDPELATAAIPQPVVEAAAEADFTSQPSSAGAGSVALQQTIEPPAPTDTQSESEQEMRFEA
jgi:phosphohistidine phosphatase SixA